MREKRLNPQQVLDSAFSVFLTIYRMRFSQMRTSVQWGDLIFSGDIASVSSNNLHYYLALGEIKDHLTNHEIGPALWWYTFRDYPTISLPPQKTVSKDFEIGFFLGQSILGSRANFFYCPKLESLLGEFSPTPKPNPRLLARARPTPKNYGDYENRLNGQKAGFPVERIPTSLENGECGDSVLYSPRASNYILSSILSTKR